MDRSLPADAAASPLASAMVEECLDLDQVADQVFARAWRESLTALSPAERRGALAGVTGHVAESVVEVLLAKVGYRLLWHFTGPGPSRRRPHRAVPLHGAGGRRGGQGNAPARYWPRLSRRELIQMSGAWVDKADNPGMANWELGSDDVYGAVVLVNFAAMAYRAAFTADF
jgi:hypothetical protein